MFQTLDQIRGRCCHRQEHAAESQSEKLPGNEQPLVKPLPGYPDPEKRKFEQVRTRCKEKVEAKKEECKKDEGPEGLKNLGGF
jgi:hypothetical protein